MATLGANEQPKNVAFKYTVMASKRAEHGRLHNLIRLIDYMIFNTLHAVVVDSLCDLLDFVTPDLALLVPPKEEEKSEEEEKAVEKKSEALLPISAAIFWVEICLEEEELAFNPNSDDYQQVWQIL